jgi:hypothetical protein
MDRGRVADIVSKGLVSLAGIPAEAADRLASSYARDDDFAVSLAVDRALAFGDAAPALALLAGRAAQAQTILSSQG